MVRCVFTILPGRITDFVSVVNRHRYRVSSWIIYGSRPDPRHLTVCLSVESGSGGLRVLEKSL